MSIEGECAKKGSFPLEELIKGIPLEERIYRHRCVEAWSMVIPWVGIPLSELIKTSRADVEGEVRRVLHARTIRARCPASGCRSCAGPTSRGCAWTKRCIR